MLIKEPVTKHEASHLDTVHRTLRRGNRPHERFIRVTNVGSQSFEMTFRYRHILRLASDATRMVEDGQPVDQLYELLEIGKRAPASHSLEVAYVGWPIDRRQHQM